MYASKRGGKNRVTGVNMPADRPSAPPDPATDAPSPPRDRGLPAARCSIATRERRRRAPDRRAGRDARRDRATARLLDPGDPGRIARAARGPATRRRPDLPDRDLHARPTPRSSARSPPIRAPAMPTRRIANPTATGARRRPMRSSPGARPAWRSASGMARDPCGPRVAARGRRPGRRAAGGVRLDPDPARSTRSPGSGSRSTSSTSPIWRPSSGRHRGCADAASSTPRPSPTHDRRRPTMRPLARLAHDAGATYLVDNTFASPYVCRPLELGADLVIESATKYLVRPQRRDRRRRRGRRDLIRRVEKRPDRHRRARSGRSTRSSSCAAS